MRILIVDDSEQARETIACQLSIDPDIEIIGYAENGKHAVELTCVLSPDLVIMDIEMPIMNGIDATRAIMQSVPTPTVIMTGNYTGDSVRMANDAGAVWICDKPRLVWNMTEIKEFCRNLKYLASTSLLQHK